MPQNNDRSKFSILTQNKFRWVLVALLLPVFGVLAAFNPTPTDQPRHIKTKSVVQKITLPNVVTSLSNHAEFWQIDKIRQDDMLGSLFKRLNIHDENAIKVLMTDPRADALNRQLVPGRTIKTKTNFVGDLLRLEYEVDNETTLTAELTPNGYAVSTQKLNLNIRRVLKSVTIVNSLFGATDAAGIPDQIALQLAEIFSGDIDFNEDLWPDDKFNVIYEAYFNAGELIKTGNVLAVEFTNKGKVYQAVRFGDAEGKFAYYTPEGKALNKSFLRSPVEFSRISSTFSKGRFHPILQRMRAHQGVDFAAPTGTRVKASGEGVVDFVGKKGGYGNVIVLKHKNGFSTVYGHLSAFAKGLRKGLKVAQSDIIGYVGMTGLATGPHLHYEFLVGKVHKDPLKVVLPTSVPINEKDRPIFNALSADYMAQINMLNRSQMATRD
ncbi:MAG: peptidoglycan DD-metalloendopeptidase family protein [Methylotenera sp.]